MLDESSSGLSPKAVKATFDTIKGISKRFNTGVLMVEQNVQEELRISDMVYVMVLGKVAAHDTGESNKVADHGVVSAVALLFV